MKRILSLILAITMVLSLMPTIAFAATSGTCGDNLTWSLDDNGTLTISGTGAMEDYTSSNAPWYSSRSSIKSVMVESGVTSIGSDAFEYCTSLTSITIPSSVTSIGSYAFEYCTSLISIEIPLSVTSIGSNAFEDCTSLTSIEIPLSITSIGSNAFEDCTSLTSITIPSSVTSIESYAFSYCTSLTSITIPSSVTSIGNFAFSSCTSLASIEIPSSVTSIGSRAFYHCESLTSIEIPSSVTSIGDHAFRNCTSLTSITIPSSVTSIGDWTFYWCKSLTSITIPSSVTSIGSFAFSNCESLTSIEIPSSVTSIGISAFSGCRSLTSIEIPSSVTSIGNGAFDGCRSLTSITIPSSVTSIGSGAFEDCTSLTSIEIPSSVTSIGNSAFNYCQSLTSIEIPSSVTSIGNYAFYYCRSLTSITIPSSVTSIGSYAFEYCTSLTSITIPKSMTSIDACAFRSCANLADVYYMGSRADREKISINSDNRELLYATWHHGGIPVEITLDKEETTLNVGDSITLVATTTPAGTANESLVWSSSNTTVATVDTNGVVTAVGAGNATITVTTEDGKHSASCTVTVTAPAPVFSPTIAYSMQANLTLESEVFMNVCFKLENLDGVDPSTLCDNVGVLIWKSEEMPSEDMATVDNCSYVIEGAEWSTANSRFEARGVGIPAKELGDTLCFRAFYKKSDGTYNYGRIISNYSPKKYCYNKLKDDTTAEDALMVAILNYGAAAQVHFGYNTNSLMNSDLSEAQKNYVWDGSLVRSDWSIPTEKEGNLTRSASITTRGGNLTLLGAIDYTYYAGISSEYTVASAKMLCWTEDDYNKASVLTPANATVVDDMEYVTANKRYEYTYKGLPAKKMFSPIYGCAMITDTNGNVHYSGVVAYCPERFAYINSSKSDQPTLANLAKTIAIYGDAARNYFGD